jgi:hypothetical protein
MRKDWKYILYVAGAIALFVSVRLMSPKQFDWSIKLTHDDKNPYGTYVLNELMPDLFQNSNIVNSYQTLYELKDSLKPGDNVIILAARFECEREDTEVLLEHVARGATALVSAQYFRGHFADTLKLKMDDHFFSNDNGDLYGRDSAYLQFANRSFNTTEQYRYKNANISHYFQEFDSARTTIVAENSSEQPVTIRVKWGKGNLILNSTPLAFSNIYLLSRHNHEFASNTLSYLQGSNVYWTEFYHVGRMESQSPLRFILTNEPLAWAYFIVIGSLSLFMLFEAKRKQRIIPIMKPLANTSLEFVSTMGNLYFHKGDHKNMAEKKINFLLDQVRSKYLLKTNHFDDEFITALANKSGNTKQDVLSLFRAISYIQSATIISGSQLVDLNDRIEHFYAAKNTLSNELRN